MPAMNRILHRKYLFWLGSICTLLILFALLYCFLPHRLFPKRESRYTPTIASVYLGEDEITTQCDSSALLDILQQTTYRKRIFPTGYTAVKIQDDLIHIRVKYVPSVIGNNWESWDIYLTPRWQYCTHSSYQWMYSIYDGRELYNSVIALCQ